MKKSQITDQAYQNVTLGSEEGALPCSGVMDASDSSKKEVTVRSEIEETVYGALLKMLEKQPRLFAELQKTRK